VVPRIFSPLFAEGVFILQKQKTARRQSFLLTLSGKQHRKAVKLLLADQIRAVDHRSVSVRSGL
jgi:hypothetical protein